MNIMIYGGTMTRVFVCNNVRACARRKLMIYQQYHCTNIYHFFPLNLFLFLFQNLFCSFHLFYRSRSANHQKVHSPFKCSYLFRLLNKLFSPQDPQVYITTKGGGLLLVSFFRCLPDTINYGGQKDDRLIQSNKLETSFLFFIHLQLE